MGNSWAQVHDVIVDQAFLAHTKNGLRIKTWQVITFTGSVSHHELVCGHDLCFSKSTLCFGLSGR